jgi:hypothetical protein
MKKAILVGLEIPLPGHALYTWLFDRSIPAEGDQDRYDLGLLGAVQQPLSRTHARFPVVYICLFDKSIYYLLIIQQPNNSVFYSICS